MLKRFYTLYMCLVVCVQWSHNQHTHLEHGENEDLHSGAEEMEAQILGSNLNINGTEDGELVDESSAESNVTFYNNMLNETWLNLVSVMDLFTQREYDNCSSVQALAAAYRYTLKQQKKLKNPPAFLKKTFIAVEGLDFEKRNMLAARLAHYMGGHVVLNPPDTFDVVLKHLPSNSSTLVNGYYILNTYIVALHVRYAIQTAPAVVPGYWLGRSAMTIATHFVDKPPPYKSKFWEWPKDLVKPDIIFYITDQQYLQQYEDRKLVRRFLHIFDNWADPKCVPLVNCESIDSMMEEADPYLQELLANRFLG